ncbi:polysaccharide biosynthesis/export family protein [Alteromonas sp. 1_MG-2023]|uniref:polysaccharide biosynthesis/export family protein n=1 Tax=Alteromonas sp. 1_MG-2023 TaxID=3062669 RepID=UPI0026E25F04|nr:polysaccharide biosynthesis/export family protein [Alteromonas sp. 1_MG-2023]MDO6568792.1 polysaccharide biosynthesis/export family protein [Alteromonas sp. 1_MG-2023]
MCFNRVVVGVIVLLTSFYSDAQRYEYTLNAGDIISIRVSGEPDLSIDSEIDVTGTLEYPFLGRIKVKSKTVSEVRWIIVDGLKGDYLLNPEVDVFIKEYRHFVINGDVISPKEYPFEPGLTFAQAIKAAGGFNESGSQKQIKVRRKLEGGVIIIENVKREELIQAGDVIIIQ